jgi:hypothetical protein
MLKLWLGYVLKVLDWDGTNPAEPKPHSDVGSGNEVRLKHLKPFSANLREYVHECDVDQGAHNVPTMCPSYQYQRSLGRLSE